MSKKAFIKWKKGFRRKCKNSGEIWFCSPESAKKCLSSKQGLNVCVSGASCDINWRIITGYNNELKKERVQFT